MIFWGTVVVSLTGSIIIFVRSGPGVDPRIRDGAAVGIFASLTAAIVAVGVTICLAAARRIMDELHAVRRDCDHVGIRRELREVVSLQRRAIDEAVYETELQLADWPPAPAATDDSGPFPVVR